MRNLLNYAGFQAGWLACVAGAGHGLFWLGPAVVTGLCAAHVYFNAHPARELRRLAAVGAFGLLLESAAQGAGLYAYRGAPASWLAPLWIVALWVLLAATYGASLEWLSRRPTLAAVLGAVASPLSFSAGARLGAVSMLVPEPAGYAFLAALWCAALPLSFSVATAAEGRRS